MRFGLVVRVPIQLREGQPVQFMQQVLADFGQLRHVAPDRGLYPATGSQVTRRGCAAVGG